MSRSPVLTEQALKRLLLFVLCSYVFLSVLTIRALGPDTVWHLKTGQYIFAHHTVPESDPFSFADDKLPFIGRFILSQYWLSQLLLSFIYSAAGTLGIVLLDASVFTAITFLIWSSLKDKGFILQLLLTAGAFSMIRNFTEVRPQIFTFLFAAVLLLLMENYRETGKIKYLLPVPALMLIWANMHGGFIYGICILFICAAAEALAAVKGNSRPAVLSGKQRAALYFVCMLSFFVSLANPNGYDAFSYAFTTHSHNLFSTIDEYQSPYHVLIQFPSPMIYGFWIFAAVSFVVMLIYVALRWYRALALLVFATVPALVSIRYIPLFVIVAVVSMRHLPVGFNRGRWTKARPLVEIFSLAIFAGLTVFRIAGLDINQLNGFSETGFFAVKASDFLNNNGVFGNIFSSYNKSAFMLFSQYPRSKVYSDSRYLSEERIHKSMAIEGQFDSVQERLAEINRLVPKNVGTINIAMGGGKGDLRPDWQALLDGINAEIIVHEATDIYSGAIYPITFKLMRSDIWRLIYLDGSVMVFVRNLPKFAGLIARYDKPKPLILEEIITETRHRTAKNNASYYSNIALSLLLAGHADAQTRYFIDHALARNPKDIIASYCQTLYALIKRHANSQTETSWRPGISVWSLSS